MNKTKVFLLAFLISIIVLGQEEDSISLQKLRKADRLLYETNYILWQWKDIPQEIDLKTIQPGFSFYYMHDMPLGNSNFAFAVGTGISVYNLHSDGRLKIDTDTGKSFFKPISNISNKPMYYRTNKLTFTYCDIPIELRFRTKGVNTFRFYAGFKVGYLLQEHSKYVGDDFINLSADVIKFKEYKHKNIEKIRYGATASIGYRWLGLNIFYSLTSIFSDDKGPDLYPISVGITIMPI